VARKNAADSAKEKAAKQKKMAIGLSVVLALAMAYAVHTMIGMGGGAASAPQAADTTATVTASTAPAGAPVTPSAPAAPSLGSVAPAATTAATSAQLVSAVPQSAGTGQLQSFSRFESKDPFNAGGPSAGTTAKQPSSSSSGGTPRAPKAPAAPAAPPAPPAAPAPAPTNAVISVNGSSETVASGSNFPAANPVFELISLTATTAKVSVVGGSYASGSATLTLKVNKAVTLVNTADGTRYVIVLMPQGTLPSSSGSSASPPAGTTTTP
jgi:hypothetical protein